MSTSASSIAVVKLNMHVSNIHQAQPIMTGALIFLQHALILDSTVR